MADWYISNGSVPYRENFPITQETINPKLSELWVMDVEYEEPDTWEDVSDVFGATITRGRYIWKIGNIYYYSYGDNNQYVLNPETLNWETKEWYGFTPSNAQYIWRDGNNVYYSYGEYQYVLDVSTSTWSAKSWTAQASPNGSYIWSDGTDVYFSNNAYQYILNRDTDTWSRITFSGLSAIRGQHIWTFKNEIYYSYNSRHYKFNKSDKSWTEILEWKNTSVDGYGVWDDGTTVYYSIRTGSTVYNKVLNHDTNTWTNKSWTGATSVRDGRDIWKYNNHILATGPINNRTYTFELGLVSYSSEPYRMEYPSFNESIAPDFSDLWIMNNDIPYRFDYPELNESLLPDDIWVITDDIPYRLDFPETNESEEHIDYTTKWVIIDDIPYRLDFPSLKASRDAKHDWYIDDDVPFQGGFPELHESEKFDFHDKWVADKENEDTGDLIFLKLTIPFTVTVTSGSDSFTLSTPFDNRKINYFDSRKNYGTRDCQLSVKLEYNVPIYQMDFTQSNDIVASVGSAGLYLFPRSDTPTTGRCTYQNTNYASESHVVSYKNTELVEPEYNNYYKSYLCVGEFDCRTVQNDHKSGSTDFTYGFIFAFHSSIPTDMDKYDRMLEYYDGYIEPFYYTRSSVPYRLDFPLQNESIPGTDIWVSDGDIPFRIEFPTLHESNGGYVGWLQNTGYEPYRPWPNHKTIFQSVQPVEVPDIDWTRSMQQTFEYFKVNPKTWNDVEQITTVISSNLTKDTDSEMRGHASIEISELIDECYIRTYLKVKQDNFTRRICLGTHLYMMQSDSFNGMRHQYNMTGYTPLVELKEKFPILGYNVTGTTGEINGKVAPMISDEIVQLLRQNTRLKVDDRVQIKQPLLNNFVAGTSDNLLTVVNNLLNAMSLKKYEMNVSERGEVYIRETINTYNERHVFEYTDDNSSILMADIDLSVDMSSIPNVLEVIYCGDKNKDIGAIRVVVKNEDPNSIVSTVSRGREIWQRYTITNIATPENYTEITKTVITEAVEAQAYRLLEAASTVKKTIQYEHGYCDVEIGDTVLFNYKRAGLIGVKAKVVSQTITCKPGCKVSETAVYTKKLWNRGV